MRIMDLARSIMRVNFCKVEKMTLGPNLSVYIERRCQKCFTFIVSTVRTCTAFKNMLLHDVHC